MRDRFHCHFNVQPSTLCLQQRYIFSASFTLTFSLHNTALTHYTTKLQVRDPNSLEIYFKHYSLTVALLTAILLYLANSLTDCEF